jgi:hypothetical protein
VIALRIVPVGGKSLVMLILVTLLPFLPVVLLSLPFEEVLRKIASLLL